MSHEKTLVGDVVQLSSDFKPEFACCFGIVERVADWGCIVIVLGPGDKEGGGARRYPVRILWNEIQRVGEAQFLPEGMVGPLFPDQGEPKTRSSP